MANKVQFFQGEKINITINGSNVYVLENIDFGCTIYPIEDISKKIRVEKANMTHTGPNQYIASFDPIYTKTLPIGIYGVEVYDNTYKIINPQPYTFNLSVAASTEYITTNP